MKRGPVSALVALIFVLLFRAVSLYTAPAANMPFHDLAPLPSAGQIPVADAAGDNPPATPSVPTPVERLPVLTVLPAISLFTETDQRRLWDLQPLLLRYPS